MEKAPQEGQSPLSTASAPEAHLVCPRHTWGLRPGSEAELPLPQPTQALTLTSEAGLWPWAFTISFLVALLCCLPKLLLFHLSIQGCHIHLIAKK